ncbi:MAG TPA: glycosyltransferase [Gaiellaceae bacterium]|nr:glycosyltransferase [Gaiellaceae bacterium]
MRVLFSSTAAEGHFLPLVPLAAATHAAGHEVVFATAASFAPRVAREGFETLPAGIDLDELERRFAPTRTQLWAADMPAAERRARAFSGRFAAIEAPAKHDALFAAAESWRADAIVHEPADLSASLVGARLRVPTIHQSFGRAIPASALKAAAELVAPLWESAGVEPDPFAGAYRGTYVDICPPSLASEPPPAGVTVHRLRPMERGAGRRAEPPLAYVTLGTVFNSVELFRDLLEAFAPLPCEVLMTVGETVDPDALGRIPANAGVARYIPQREILPRASVVVSHGGSGSTLGALAHGCPIVFVPQGADQFENALATADAGAGIVVTPERQSVPNLREALRTVLIDPAYAERAEGIAQEITGLPAPSRVVESLFGGSD